MKRLTEALNGNKRILSILALLVVLWLKVSGHGDFLPLLNVLGLTPDGVPVTELGVSIAALYAAWDGSRKNRAAQRAETHVTPRPGDGPVGLGR